MVYLPGYSLIHHARLMEELTASLAPGTWRNKIAHVKAYFQFCTLHQVDHFNPGVYDLLSFLLFLKDKLRSPGAVMNYYSSVKGWITASSGSLSVFNAPEIVALKRGIFKNSLHTPFPAPAMSVVDFKQIIVFLVNLEPCPYVLIAALLLAFFTMARQSNLVTTAVDLANCDHLLRFRDITLLPDSLLVTL